MDRSPQGEEQVRRSIETNGPADPLVVRLENELNLAVQAGAAPGQVTALKQQLLTRYLQAMVERGAGLAPSQFGQDVFFEVYNQRIVALSDELGRAESSPVALAHLFLSGVYRQRDQLDMSRQQLAQFRKLAERQPDLISCLGDGVVGPLTTMVQALLRPTLPFPTPESLLMP
jgi:hypothetical protein|tara:strand:- start:1463 stop:1981 length:519 start_codon:yes stop_codon:yes gene_type:complete